MRQHYHASADRNTYDILHEKTHDRPWYEPAEYSINVDPRSRLFDYSNPDDPQLPHPGPDLYSYQLPELRDGSVDLEPLPPPDDEEASQDAEASDSAAASDARTTRTTNAIQLASALTDIDSLEELVLVRTSIDTDGEASSDPPYADAEEGLTIQPIPREYWDALPQECLSRMLEFESVREEFRRTFGTEPPDTLRDRSRKLTFKNIVELAYLNSREYQTQKEALYTTALALTLQRYDYMTKFSTFGNSMAAEYDHIRVNGITSNTLSTPSAFRMERMTALGGTVVASFANSVVLTYNGPAGFAEVINSTLLFDFTQSVFQRDILLEPLTRAERNVVYAARDFARFRKQFYLALARTYYQDLLSTYRGIEIDTQNYFAFVRALDQAEAEVRSGVGDAQPRFQIDQIKQNMLGGRSRLITTCNTLETSLDRLKLTLGLPTETPLNIDLRELETLTRRDEIEVAGELIQHARERVELQVDSEVPDREEVLSAAVVLLDRIIEWMDLRDEVARDQGNQMGLRVLRARLRIEEAYEATDRAERLLLITRQPPAAPISVFRGTMYLIQARLGLVARQLQLSDELPDHAPQRDEVLEKFIELNGRVDAILEAVGRYLRGEDEDLAALQVTAEAILQEVELLDSPARRMVGAPDARPNDREELQRSLTDARQLLETTDQLAFESQGLTSVDMSADDAMVTALVQRFDLMNQRGFLADDWRGIKLAADDLKSVLNLNARQTFTTRNNRPFAFNFEDSRTEAGAALDLPLNRRAQRNLYKQSLINYQVGRRALMALEDNIKFSARQDLRQLNLDRVQYEISVVSAALASERVYSTQLELSLGLANATARDFLEAQQAYRQSVSAVANGRLGYIVNRAQLAFDLEAMMLDDEGLWPDLNNEQYQPLFDPVSSDWAGQTYGELPARVWHSKWIRRQLNHPSPGYQVIDVNPVEDSSTEGAEPEDAAAEGPLVPVP